MSTHYLGPMGAREAGIGPFRLLCSLGIGGMGRVWAAAPAGASSFDDVVALKVIAAERMSDPHARAMFLA